MKFSLITLLRNPQDLGDAYKTIAAQTFGDWQWIVAPGPNVPVPEFRDPRVCVVRLNTSNATSGAMKKMAFGSARGDVLVDMSADDLLVENCLAELARAFGGSDADLVYSNAAIPAEAVAGLGEGAGWEHRPFEWHGRRLVEVKSFEPSAASLAFLWYCPGPLRAWRKPAYDAIGGHNPSIDLVDDHELMIRTYLRLRMKSIERPLCVSRGSGRDPLAQDDVNRRVYPLTLQLYFESAYQLAEREADLHGLAKIDLCGGFSKPPGYTSLDQAHGDITCDLNQGIPLPTGSVGVVRADDAIEHLKSGIVTMSEIHRVLADGGWAMIMVPSTDGRGAFQDPTHVSFWNENSFWYWTRAAQAQYIRNHTAKFQAFRLDTHFPTEGHRQTNISYVSAHLRAVKSKAPRPHYQTI